MDDFILLDGKRAKRESKSKRKESEPRLVRAGLVREVDLCMHGREAVRGGKVKTRVLPAISISSNNLALLI